MGSGKERHLIRRPIQEADQRSRNVPQRFGEGIQRKRQTKNDPAQNVGHEDQREQSEGFHPITPLAQMKYSGGPSQKASHKAAASFS